MGIVENSFKREIGKNAGKVVSNVFFGDMHSTPYRRVSEYREPRKTQADLRHEQRMEQIESEERLRFTLIESQNKIKQKEQLLLIDSAVIKNVDKIATLRIPTEKEELISLLSELSTYLNANKFQKEKDEENKIRNKFSSALFEKYKQCILALRLIDPESLQLNHFESIAKKYKWQKFLTIHKTLFVFACIFVSISLFHLIDYLYIQQLLVPVFVIIVAIVATLAIVFLLNRKKTIKKTQSKKEECINISTEQQEVEKEYYSIFIDLNDNNRIETNLSRIWTKYSNSVDKQIINRRPIFSADGIKDSILFVGVSPSYNPNDDKFFIESTDKKSLLYGSLYQINDAPEYFKELEKFANQIGKAYTHTNLLYARENDRDVLLSCDHNFIREQLELTYDTIIKINPVAIIFFTDYCKNIIFGADRWINPATERNGSFILNGTNYPVFFSNDITTMNENERFALIQKIKYITKL